LKFSFKIAFYKAVRTQDRSIQILYLPFFISKIFLSPFTLYKNTPFHTRSHIIIFSVFSSTTSKNIQSYNPHFELSNFQQIKKLCSKCSTLQFTPPLFAVKGCLFEYCF
jgi:hypothetical protein